MSSGDGDGQHHMTVPDLEPAARRLAALLDGVPDSALPAPTPCADSSVATLLDHIMGLSEGLALAWVSASSQGSLLRPVKNSLAELEKRAARTALPSSA